MPFKDREVRNAYLAKYKLAWRKIPNGAYSNSKLKNKERKREQAKKYYKELKILVLSTYSNGDIKCFCCGETELHFLGIDHINNDGAEHRRLIRNKGGTVMYRWLKNNNFPDGHRVCCHNCNLGRHVNGGVCPHEKVKNEERPSMG